MTRKEMTNERAQSDACISSAERGGIGRSQIESLFKTHYTQMYHLALTLLFDEAESKDVVSDVFASLLSGKVVMRADNAKAFLLASVHHRCLNVLQHKQVQERFSRLLTEDADTLISGNTSEEQMQMEELMRYVQDNQEKDRIIRQKESIINDYRDRLGHYLSTLSELLRGAVKAVIDYVQSGYRSFSYRQDCDVRRYINGQTDKDEAANTVLNASRPFLKANECECVKGQLSYIVNDMKEEQQQSRSRGFHM